MIKSTIPSWLASTATIACVYIGSPGKLIGAWKKEVPAAPLLRTSRFGSGELTEPAFPMSKSTRPSLFISAATMTVVCIEPPGRSIGAKKEVVVPFVPAAPLLRSN